MLTTIEEGFVPHCPHLTVFCEFMEPDRIPYEKWLELDKNYIDNSDAVLRIPGHSPGADRECEYALSKGIPVFQGINQFFSGFEGCLV